MKVKVKNVALRVRLVVFAISLLSFALPASAKPSTYYCAKLTVTADAGGKVWANTSSSATGASYAESCNITGSERSSSSSASVQFYVYAQGNKGYKFSKWAAASGVTLGPGAASTAAGASVTISSRTPSGRVRPYVRATWSQGEMNYRRVEE